MAAGLLEKYRHTRGFVPQKISAGLPRVLATMGGLAPTTEPNALALISKLGADPRVTDIRAMAYILATVSIESREIRKFSFPKLVNLKPVMNAKTGQPELVTSKLWQLYVPVNETGYGRGREY